MDFLGMGEELEVIDMMPESLAVSPKNSKQIVKVCKRKYVVLRRNSMLVLAVPKNLQELVHKILGDEVYISITPAMIYVKGAMDSTNAKTTLFIGKDKFFIFIPKELEHLIPWRSGYLPFFVYDNRINVSLRYLIDAQNGKLVKMR